MRVCLDTNVLVAAFTTRGLCADVMRTVLAEHELVIGEVIKVELLRVLRTKFKVPEQQLRAVEAILHSVPMLPKPKKKSTLRMNDSSDLWVHATALEGDADVIVTGDKEFIRAGVDSAIPIVEPRRFWEMLRESE